MLRAGDMIMTNMTTDGLDLEAGIFLVISNTEDVVEVKKLA